MIESAELQELLAKWDSNEGRPFKGSLIDMRAYEASPDSLGCMLFAFQMQEWFGS